MKKFFTFVMALVTAVTLNAATQVTFDFSDASAYGYANPAQGAYTTLPTGSTLTKDGVVITVAYSTGNGFRFTSNQNTGVINFRGYVNASYTIAAPAGKKLSAISAEGSNLTSQYLSGGMTSADWTSATGVESLATNVIKSTVQFNSLVVTLIEDGEVPPTQENIQATVAEAIAAGMALDSAKTSTDIYDVTGYVVNAQAYSAQHGNQIWFMADDAANTGAQEFEAYACTVSENNTIMQVLNGDKVKLTGKLTKYYDKNNNKFIIEIKNGTAVFVSKVEGDHSIDGGTPVVAPDTISVDSALVLGAALADKAYTDKEYVVEGYVLGAEDFDFAYKNQSWLMADSATAETSIFKAFRCIPVYNNDTVKVLNGDKVRICGKIQKYGELIEISYSKAEFISMVEGDHSAVEPVQEELDTITVARALEIGEALEAGKSSDSIYVIAGYVSKIITAYDTASKNESFWMVDTMGSRAASNAAGAFEVYRGKMDTIAEQDAMVYVKAKIYKYQPMKNNQPNGDPVIETANNPIPEVHVAVAGHAEVIEAITIAQALAIGDSIGQGSTSGDRYEITGYVSSIEAPFSEQYKNETFWITDDSTSTANSTAAGAFYVYRGKPNTQAEIGMHAKIKIVCYIVNYSGKIENDNANNAFEVLKQGEELKYDTISVADAITKTQTLAPGATSSETYVVKGYLVNISTPYDSQYKNMSFYIDDEYPAEDNKFQCYRASIADTDVEKAVLGAYVAVTGKLDNNSHGLQMASGAKVEFLPAPQIDTIEVTVAQAVEVAAGLEPLVKTADWYSVTGYVSELESEYNEEYGTQSFWLANEKGGVNAFHAFQAKLKMAVAVGQEVVIFGKIMRFDDPVLETIEARMEGGRVTKIDGQDQGIENIVLTEKAQKVLVEGQIFIIRDNKLYNLQGARVR